MRHPDHEHPHPPNPPASEGTTARLRQLIGRPIRAQASADALWTAAVTLDRRDASAALRSARSVVGDAPFAVELLCSSEQSGTVDSFVGIRLTGGSSVAEALVEATRDALHSDDPLASWIDWVRVATGSPPFMPKDAQRMELGRFDAWVDPIPVSLSAPPPIDAIPRGFSDTAATPPALELAFAGASVHWVGLHVGARRATGWVLDPDLLSKAHAALVGLGRNETRRRYR